jgi:hypothetical protein
MKNQNYFATFHACLEQASKIASDRALAFVDGGPSDKMWTGGVAYGTTLSDTFPIKTIKGKNTRKVMVFTVYRLESGNYELNCYVA